MDDSISRLMIQLGIEDDNDTAIRLLTLIYEDSVQEVLDYTRRDYLLPEMESIVRHVTLVNYNRQGMQGEEQRTEGGVSVRMVEIPSQLKARLKRYMIGRVRML